MGERGPAPKPIQHGTYGGYQAHNRRNEKACLPCTDAMSARAACQRRAMSRLAKEHPQRFAELLAEEQARDAR